MHPTISDQDARELAENIIDTIHEPLIILDADLKVISASRSFYNTFKVQPKETEGHYIYELGNNQWDIPVLRILLEEILLQGSTFNKFEVEHDFVGIGRRTMLLNARQVLRSAEKPPIILLAIEDITEHREAEFAETLIDTIHEPLVVLDAKLQVVSASLSFYQTFAITPEESVGRFIYEIGNHKWDLPKLRTLLEDILPHRSNFDNFKVEYDLEDQSHRILLLNARRIPTPPQAPRLILLAFKDMTEFIEMQSYKGSLEFAESIINTIPEPLIVLDKTLQVISANRSFYQIFQVTPKEIVGHFIYEIRNQQWNITKLRHLLNDVLIKNTGFDSFEVKQEVLDKEAKIFWLKAQKIISEKRETNLILLSFEDISKRREAEEEFSRIFKAKSAFTNMVSHELRTPLTSLEQSINLLAKGKLGVLNPEQKRFLDIAERNLDRLVSLINNVLDFQKLESGKMTYKIEENDINSVIKEIREMMLPLIEKKRLEFIVKTEKNLPKINFDKDKIIQVLTNLVNNALRATEKGYIQITTSLIDDFIQVSIHDTGCGIKPKNMNKLFQEYEQLERIKGGTGLGLVISQAIILAHGGRIWTESTLGQGTTMHFILPVQRRDL